MELPPNDIALVWPERLAKSLTPLVPDGPEGADRSLVDRRRDTTLQMMWLYLMSAFAQPAEEVTVYGDPQVAVAREALIAELTRLGYDRKVIHRADRVVMKHQSVWRGKVVVYDDGYLRHRRQGVVMSTPEVGIDGPLGDIVAAPLCIIQPTACVRAGGLLVSGRKLAHEKRRTTAAVQPTLGTLGDRLADAKTTQTVAALPERLDALWQRGEPLLDGSVGPIDGWPARRAHVLDFWDSRTDNAWGERVREVVSSFIRGEIMASEHPYTEPEITAFNQETRSEHALVFNTGAPRGAESEL